MSNGEQAYHLMRFAFTMYHLGLMGERTYFDLHKKFWMEM